MVEGVHANEESPNLNSNADFSTVRIVDDRKLNSSEALVTHITPNSIQNKFDQLKYLNETLKAHVLIIFKTKIDGSYPNSQFAFSGYRVHRKDRAKRGGRLIAHIASTIPSRKLNLEKASTTFEVIAVEVKKGVKNITLPAWLCIDHQAAWKEKKPKVINTSRQCSRK